MSIIQQLHQTVTPKVLSLLANYSGEETAKRGALSSLYSLLGARLSDPTALARIEGLNAEQIQDGNAVLDAVLRDENGAPQLASINTELAKQYNLPESTVGALTNNAAPLVLNELKTLSGGASLSAYLQDKVGDFAEFLPDWAEKLLPIGLLTGAAGLAGGAISGIGSGLSSIGDGIGNLADKATNTVSDLANDAKAAAAHVSQTSAQTPNQESSFMKTLLPIVGAIIFAGLAWMLLRGCQDKTTPVAAPVAATASASEDSASQNAEAASLLAPTLAFATGDQGLLNTGALANVGNEDLKGKLLSAVTGVFGADAEKALTVNVDPAYDINFPVIDKLPDVLNLVKAVPNAGLQIDGNKILVSAPDAAADKLIADIRALLPDFSVELNSNAAVAVADASTAEAAPAAASSNEATAEFIDGRLKLYFATGKADIAAQAVEKAKDIIEAAKAGKKIGISGFTDSTGNAAANEALSKRRAEATKAFLIENGVQEAQIELIKPEDTVGATGKDQEGRRVEVFIVE